MEMSTVWWMGAGVLLALEMTTGTFYLLMLALGMTAAAMAAHGGWSLSQQITLAAIVGLVAVLGWHLVRKRQTRALPARADRSVNLDIGEVLQIDEWSEQGQASVRYRGAQWTAVLRTGQPVLPGLHRVVELSGNRLIVEKT
jgi:membrane protein implicated in regulation of membrane protease activity